MKKVFLNILQNSPGCNHATSFFNKVAGGKPGTLPKRESNAGSFLWFGWNSKMDLT